MIKPDGVERGLTGEVISRFEKAGLKITALKMLVASRETLEQHYPINDRNYVLTLGHTDIEGKNDEELEEIYKKNHGIITAMHESLQVGPVVPMVVEGPEGTVAKIREIVGKTDPTKADKGTIRGDYAADSFEAADQEKRAVRNIVHASGSPEEAENEIGIWFPELAKGE